MDILTSIALVGVASPFSSAANLSIAVAHFVSLMASFFAAASSVRRAVSLAHLRIFGFTFGMSDPQNPSFSQFRSFLDRGQMLSFVVG